MSTVGHGGFAQGRASNRPPLFCGNNFGHWRSLMQMFVIDQDLELWDIIKNCPRIPMKINEEGINIPKDESEYSQTDLEKVAKNYKAINLLYCGLDENEFDRVRACKSAKEIWDKLVVTYEGTSQVRETKISIFTRQYELFKMQSKETVKEMFTRFTQIVNNLDSLGKTFTNEEKVRKILRCLPKEKWGPKVTAIEEAQNLRVLSLDDLLGKLITHEMTLNEEDGELPVTIKNLSLKVKKEEYLTESDQSDDEDDEDPFALITRGLARILKMKKQFSTKNRNFPQSSKYKGKSSNSVNKVNILTCYECGETDHLVRDCPKRKKDKFIKKDKRKKAMIASTWSDSDSSIDSDDEHANLCLMADHEDDKDKNIKIIIDGRDVECQDVGGCRMPTLVYLAREKRPDHFHNFKAGAMNALIRVSSEISNGAIILNVDCDMYSNNSQSIQDALCFFMDEEKGHGFAFVQFPQRFHNLTRNELYGGSLRVICEVDLHGMDGHGGPPYIGTGCFHRRDTLCGRKFTKESKFEWEETCISKNGESVDELEKRIKDLASCKFEKNTQWGNEMGIKYGCPVEDVITGLSIQCRGWKSIYFNPKMSGFLGVAATTLDQLLLQHKRWSEGDLQIFLSKYNPFWYGSGKISPGLSMAYCICCLWSPNCIATIYYSIMPSLFLLNGISLFPKVSSLWFIPFIYLIITEHIYSLAEFLWSNGTALGWWNEQRIWLYKRTSSYLFALIDTLLKLAGYSNSAFVISAKVSEEAVMHRYEQELMEFGTNSPMFTILSSLAMLNLLCFIGLIVKVIGGIGGTDDFLESMALQILVCGVLVLINLPLYNAAFFRSDKGSMPSSITVKSVVVALILCTSFTLM